jgi:hypothetical protein
MAPSTDSTLDTTWRPAMAPGVLWLLWAATIAHAAATCVLPLLRAEAPIAYLTAYWDDFFYYLQIARNLAGGLGSTFDGISPTNGYHPLWLLVLTALCAVLDPTTMDFHVVLAALIAALSVTTALLVFRYAGAAFALPPPLAAVLALVGQTFYATLARHGMEVALAIPLLLGCMLAGKHFVDRPSFRRMAIWSLLGALTILSRIDTAIAVLLTGAALLAFTRKPELHAWVTAPIAAGFAIGTLPLAIYFIVNIVVFGSVLPISGQAKQLAPFPVFSTHALGHLVREPLGSLLHGRFSIYLTSGLVPALISLLAILVYARTRPRERSWAAVHLALLLFPFALLAAQCLVSDWILWPWYLYALIPAAISALAALVRAGLPATQEKSSPLGLGAVAAIAVVIVADPAVALLHGPQSGEARLEYGMADASRAVADFAARHDGLFAMGDRAGRVGFLVPNRVIQLEGLVGAPDLLHAIAARANLLDVLRARGVRYYIGTRMDESAGCFLGEEPKIMQSGAASPRMTGRFCSAPVLRHVDNRGVVTMIFDVAAEGPKR